MLTLTPYHRNIPKKTLLADLRATAKKLGTTTLSRTQYDAHGTYSSQTIKRRFTTWNHAITLARLTIHRQQAITTTPLFQNLQHLWLTHGRQPRQADLHVPHSRYTLRAYRATFGTWRQALTQFIQYADSHPAIARAIERATAAKLPARPHHKTTRTINTRLRYTILARDHFRCTACGISPATHPGTTLHIDHIIPWHKGGETIPQNLQTLCSTCNLGKSDL